MSGSQHLLLGAVPQVVSDPYFEYNTLLLPGNGTNGAQNNTFLDSSTNAFSITRNGNTTQGTFSPFSQTGWSNYFDGTGDYLSVADNTALDISGQFTWECWVYFSSISGSSDNILYSKLIVTPSVTGLEIGVNTTGKFYVWINGSVVITSTSSVSAGQWVHLAASRDGSNNVRIFINGTSAATAVSNSADTSTSASVILGANYAGSARVTGYISNFRLVKGTAVYTANFTPSTTPLTAISGTSLLTCQSNRFIDNSTNAFAITRNGDVSVQAFSPFNPTAAWSAATYGGSGYFDGSGDYLVTPSNTAFAPGSGDWTFEGWFYATVKANRLVQFSDDNGNLTFNRDGVSNLGAYINGVDYSFGSTPTNSWVHFAISVTSGTCSGYLNGTRVFNFAGGSATSSARSFSIGAGTSGADPFTGYISNLRYVKGTGVYSGTTITVPTAPLTAITNTSLLCNFTNAGIYDATSKNDLETVGNAQISTTQSKFGGSSMYFDGTDDRLVAPSNIDVAIGTADFTIEGWFYTASPATNRGLFQISTTAGGLEAGNTNNLAVYCSSSVLGVYYASTFKAGTTSISANTWTHFALVRTGGSTKLYVNGTADSGFGTNADTQNYTGKNVCLGGYFSTAYLWSGYIQDFRITRGYARYTSNFTAPTAAFPLF